MDMVPSHPLDGQKVLFLLHSTEHTCRGVDVIYTILVHTYQIYTNKSPKNHFCAFGALPVIFQ